MAQSVVVKRGARDIELAQVGTDEATVQTCVDDGAVRCVVLDLAAEPIEARLAALCEPLLAGAVGVIVVFANSVRLAIVVVVVVIILRPVCVAVVCRGPSALDRGNRQRLCRLGRLARESVAQPQRVVDLQLAQLRAQLLQQREEPFVRDLPREVLLFILISLKVRTRVQFWMLRTSTTSSLTSSRRQASSTLEHSVILRVSSDPAQRSPRAFMAPRPILAELATLNFYPNR